MRKQAKAQTPAQGRNARMTATPKTDKVSSYEWLDGNRYRCEVVHADFARGLEKKLSAALSRVNRLSAKLRACSTH